MEWVYEDFYSYEQPVITWSSGSLHPLRGKFYYANKNITSAHTPVTVSQLKMFTFYSPEVHMRGGRWH